MTPEDVLKRVQWCLAQDDTPVETGVLSSKHRWWVRDTLRYLHAQAAKAAARGRRAEGERCALVEVAQDANRSWAALAPPAKAALAEQALKRDGLEPWQRRALSVVAAEFRRCAEQEPDHRQRRCATREEYVQATSVLLTWQGAWGVIDDVGTRSRSAQALDALTRALREHPAVVALWDGVRHRLAFWAERLRLESWACSCEVCVRTLEDSGEVRVHVHAFVQRTSQLRTSDVLAMRLGGTTAHRSKSAAHTRARGRNLQSCYSAGLYYCQAPKVGQVFSAGNKRPFKDYIVSVDLITQMWQQDKLSDQDTVAQYVLNKKDVDRHVSNLRRQVALREELALQERAASARAQLSRHVRPPRKVPEVEAWLKEQACVRFRQKFLVLDGASQLGKTRFAHSLRGEAATLDVNCSGVQTEPDLRSFRPSVHATILFDEASCSMVVRNKKLFQAPPDPVQLGQSSTNCFAYTISVHQCLLVVASNKWAAELEDLSEADRAWLQANQAYVHVTEPLWL